MFKEMWDYMPTWVKIFVIVWLPLAIGGAVYSINECGFFRAMLMGDNALYAAYSGMCND